MIGVSRNGHVRSFRADRDETWMLLTGAHFGVAYQIVPVNAERSVWRWTFYPPIGCGSSRSEEIAGGVEAAAEACRAAIRGFVDDIFGGKRWPRVLEQGTA